MSSTVEDRSYASVRFPVKPIEAVDEQINYFTAFLWLLAGSVYVP